MSADSIAANGPVHIQPEGQTWQQQCQQTVVQQCQQTVVQQCQQTVVQQMDHPTYKLTAD
jgi:hypothetical protein